MLNILILLNIFVFLGIIIILLIMLMFLRSHRAENGRVRQVRTILFRVIFAKVIYFVVEIFAAISIILGVDVLNYMIIVPLSLASILLLTVDIWALVELRKLRQE